MPNPNLPPNLPAWLDRVEAYCKASPSSYSEPNFYYAARTDLPLAIQVIRGLMKREERIRRLIKDAKHFATVFTYGQRIRGFCEELEAALQEAQDG